MPDNDKIEPSKTPIIKGCPMPECGGECVLPMDRHRLICKSCDYRSGVHYSDTKAITVHNRLCKHARLGELVKKVIENPPEAYKLVEALAVDDCTEYIRGWKAAEGFWIEQLTLPDQEPAT